MLKNLGLLATFFVYSAAASAASVNWSVGEVSIQIYAKDFQITAVESTMTCRLSDGSGIFTALPTENLNVNLTQDNSFAGEGAMYTVEIEAGNVNGGKMFAELRSCAYYIDVYSEQENGEILSGRTTLASASEKSEIEKLIQDEDLNEKINSEQALIKLELSENKAVIVEAE